MGEEVFPVAREVLGAADAPRVTLGVRPEDLEVLESGGLLIEADVVEELGADAVETAREAGALGARMVGGGFGGFAVALIRSTDAAAVGKAVVATCRQREFTEPGVFTVTSGAAARRHTPRSDG